MKSIYIIKVLFFTGIVSTGYAQNDSIYSKLESGDPGTEFTKRVKSGNEEQLMDSKENYAVIGRNLRNADGSEMGPFLLEGQDPKSVQNVSGSKPMPQPGFNNLAYAKAMTTKGKTKTPGSKQLSKEGNMESGKKPEKKSEKKSEKI